MTGEKKKIFSKVFKDPLYDYIKIDNDICDKIIDNKYFQRLRRIEQTSMRCLYPSARHDRFIHSIGVYHLAKTAIKALKNNEIVDLANDNEKNYNLSNKEWKNIKFTFEMAALLHDIGHSPFSHTLESYFSKEYQLNEDGDDINEVRLENILFDEASKINSIQKKEVLSKFKDDCNNASAAPHEIMSCIIVFRQFKKILDELAEVRKVEVDYLFLARCILGAKYSDETIDNNDYKNCVIKLLNSAIDVDKLDYIARDSSVSGFANTLVDTKRLLASIILVKYKNAGKVKMCLAFKKTAVGVIQNAISSRNALYMWVYSHHKVVYESKLIKDSIRKIADKLAKNTKNIDGNLFISKYFSVHSIEDNLVCDDTVWNLFTEHKDQIPKINEIIQRSSQKKALWKSFAEFQAYFHTKKEAAIGEYSSKKMEDYLSNEKYACCKLKEYMENFNNLGLEFDVVVNKLKLSHLKPNEIMIYINDKLYPLDSIFAEVSKESEIPPFFYVYCNKETKEKLNENNKELKNKFINYIKKFDEFILQPLIDENR